MVTRVKSDRPASSLWNLEHEEGAEAHRLHDLPKDDVRALVRLFKLLSDETRLQILYLLVHDPEMHVRAICESLQESQPAVSHHLALLREAGLIAPRRDGKHNFYHLVPQQFQDLINRIFAAVPEAERNDRFATLAGAYSPDGETRM